MKNFAIIALLSQSCEAIKFAEQFSYPAEEVTVLWHATPDYVETNSTSLDDHVVSSEQAITSQ